MSIRSDYIPRKSAELVAWSANFTAEITANAGAWDIPPGEVDALESANAAFATLHGLVDSPAKTSIIVAEKNAARATLVKKIRELAGFRLRNPVITGAQRIALGLHVRTTTYATIPAPKSRPELSLHVVDFRRLKVLFHDKDSDSRAKPYGINGAVIAYAVSGVPPAGVHALTHSVLATRTPHFLEFTEEERGKTIYVAICWQNLKGKRGPWSEIESALIP
ncbi:MAG: hypothetical protein LBD87_06580 [Prevotellaceae bacterium]|jgi:hypothetical protein|nr:hypothetical protein [Prevotellaceae bacterium]